MRKTVYILAVFLAVAAVSLPGCKKPTAGWGSLSGHVTASVSGEPLEGVSVMYGDSAVMTDSEGAYFYEGVPDGLQGIRFSMGGYYPLMKQVNIAAGGEVVCDVVMDIITAGWAVGAGDSGYGTILYTTDAGRSWTRQGTPSTVPDVKLTDVCTVNDQNCWIVGEADTLRAQNVIMHTSDGGANWTNQGASVRTARPVSMAAVVAHDSDTAWAVTADTCLILKTVNGGSSWSVCGESLSAVSYSAVAVLGRELWCCGRTEDGQAVIDYSSDGGATWYGMPVSAVHSLQELTDITVSSDRVLYLSGTNAMGVLCSKDGGLTWEAVLDSDADITALDMCYDTYIWAAATGGRMYLTTDGFVTRQEISPAANAYSSGRVSSVSFLRDAVRGVCSVMSSSGASGTIYYTADGGNTWVQSAVPFDFSIESVDFAGGNN